MLKWNTIFLNNTIYYVFYLIAMYDQIVVNLITSANLSTVETT